MTCLYCHNTVDDDCQFCAECGHTISVESKLTSASHFWKNFQNEEKIDRANYVMYIQDYITKAHNQYRFKVLMPFIVTVIALIVFFVPLGSQMSIAGSIRTALENGIDFPVTERQNPEQKTTERQDLPSKIPMSVDEKLQYFINNCGSYFFTRSDIEDFNKEMSMLARNSIYAQAGRSFSDNEALNIYFSQYNWYNPIINPSDFHDSMMNRFEVVNLYLVLDYEMEMGFRKIRDVDRRFKNFILSCGNEVFDLDYLQEFDSDMTLIARSAIYAKSGQAFDSEYLAAFFSQFDWYVPVISERNFREESLNSYQRRNLDIVFTYERENGFYGTN